MEKPSPSVETRSFLKEYTRALRNDSAALFIGSGISRSAGYVDWKQLLKEIADELELDIDRESDLVALAQFHVNHRQGRDRLSQLLIDEFLEDVELTPNHKLIASLPIHTLWTTNYDDLLEVSFGTAHKRVDVKRRPEDFAVTRRRTDVTIYKMHGDRTNPSDAVLTKEDYETYNVNRELFTIALKGDLAKKTFLFLGFSFTDPNVVYILGRVKQLLERNSRKHYCVLKIPNPDEFDDGEYQCKRFSHWLADLHRYNIQPILIEQYDDVTQILTELNRRSHLRDVFISGSAADFSPLGEEKFNNLCLALGSELIKKDFNIISGFGVGVGDAVVIGAMQSLRRNDDERLQLFPFPQQVPAGVDRTELWREYRERIISTAGVCLVLGGNKLSNGSVVLSDGVMQEVDIALSLGKIVIPIGATGHVAQQLWEDLKSNPCKYLGLGNITSQIETLGDPNAGVPALVNSVIEVLKQLER